MRERTKEVDRTLFRLKLDVRASSKRLEGLQGGLEVEEADLKDIKLAKKVLFKDVKRRHPDSHLPENQSQLSLS